MQLRKNIVNQTHCQDADVITKEKAIEVLKKQGEIQMNLAPM